MKKIATIAGSIVLLAATVIPALAANNCSNSTTGPLATNYCTVNNSSTVTVNNVNDAYITNNVTTRANSGGNSASYNTLGGAISTGNATVNATVSSVANINTTTVSGGPAASNNSGTNNITGPSSDNRININNTRVVDVWNSNTANVTNNVDVTADTGKNKADYNTGPASVTTGNASLRTAIGTHVNDSATGIQAGAGGTGGNSGGNSTTGPFSINYVDIINTSRATVNNVNDLIVGNFVGALSNSGTNSASYNTLGGTVGTGNAGANVGVNTEGNINTTTIEMAMGGFANAGGNGVTGPDSENRVSLLNSQNILVDNWNNKCRSHNAPYGCSPSDLGVYNYNYDVADTGNNASNYNTGGGGVIAGIADLVKSLLTHLNDTLTVINQ